MRVRSLVTALSAAVCCAVASIPTFAQDSPGGALSISARAAVPSGDAAQRPSDNAPAAAQASPSAAPPPTVVQTTPQPVAATPVVESIRSKLAEFDKASSSNDVSALVAFYNERGEPLWMTD